MSDPINDPMGYLADRNLAERQRSATRAVQNEVAELRAQLAEQERGPKCPFCGGTIKLQNAELCMHCRSKLAWVHGVVCKPGQERQVLEKLKKRQKDKAAAQAQFQKELAAVKKEWKELQSFRKTGAILILSFLPVYSAGVWLMMKLDVFSLFWPFNFGCWLFLGWIIYYQFFSKNGRRVLELKNKYGLENLR